MRLGPIPSAQVRLQQPRKKAVVQTSEPFLHAPSRDRMGFLSTLPGVAQPPSVRLDDIIKDANLSRGRGGRYRIPVVFCLYEHAAAPRHLAGRIIHFPYSQRDGLIDLAGARHRSPNLVRATAPPVTSLCRKLQPSCATHGYKPRGLASSPRVYRRIVCLLVQGTKVHSSSDELKTPFSLTQERRRWEPNTRTCSVGSLAYSPRPGGSSRCGRRGWRLGVEWLQAV